MGVYYKVANPAKRQYIDADSFNSEVKASGLFYGWHGIAVALLLCDTNEVRDFGPLAGSWSGDRVIVAGDSSPDGRYDIVSSIDPNRNLYFISAHEYENISYRSMGMLILAHLDIADDMATAAVASEYALLHFGHAAMVLIDDKDYHVAAQQLDFALQQQFDADWRRRWSATRQRNQSWAP